MSKDVNVRQRKRRRRGVPGALVAFLLILILLFGVAAGYMINNLLTGYQLRSDLDEAKLRIAELEAELTSENSNGDLTNNSGDLDGSSDTAETDEGMVPVSELGGDGIASEESAQAESVVVAEFDGGTIMSDEVLPLYDDEIASATLMGVDVNAMASDIMHDVIYELVCDKLEEIKAEELGFNELTDKDLEEISQEADRIYEESGDFYEAVIYTDDMSDEELQEAAKAYIEEELKSSRWKEKLFDYVTEGVTVDEDAVRQMYESTLASQKSSYEQYPADYEYQKQAGGIVLYNPEGYRMIDQILIAFDSEDAVRCQTIEEELAGLDPAADVEVISELEAELEELYAKLQAEADEVMDRLEAGEDFDELMEEYSDDEMRYEMEGGYCISENTSMYSEDFITAAMALANVGDYSEPVRSTSGLHIIRYSEEITPGEVDFESVRSQLEEEMLKDVKQETYDAELAKWYDEANVVTHEQDLQ